MKRRKFAITFEKELLNRLILEESSCVVLKQCTHHLALHPYHLNNVSESLNHILGKGIAKYDKTLGGILLGYQNMKLLSSAGSLNNDTCFIHVDISADFFLFKPEVGNTLSGVVNKKSEDHVGCLVYEAFNVSLPKPSEDDDDWIGSVVEIGQEILFQINFLDLEGRLPYIRATFISILSELDSGISTGEDTNDKKPSKKKLKAKKIVFNSNSETEEIEFAEVKKKKKRKSADKSQLSETNEAEEVYTENKKKRKRKIKEDPDEVSESNLELSVEDVSPDFESPIKNESKKHKKKKPKMDHEPSDAMQFDDIREHETSHKHKKKHKVKIET